jgi:hypothetical protein
VIQTLDRLAVEAAAVVATPLNQPAYDDVETLDHPADEAAAVANIRSGQEHAETINRPK